MCQQELVATRMLAILQPAMAPPWLGSSVWTGGQMLAMLRASMVRLLGWCPSLARLLPWRSLVQLARQLVPLLLPRVSFPNLSCPALVAALVPLPPTLHMLRECPLLPWPGS